MRKFAVSHLPFISMPNTWFMQAPLRRTSFTVRTRLILVVVILTAGALVLAGFSAFSLQRDRIDARIDDQLELAATEFTQLVNSGYHPVTGAPLASVTDAMSAAIQLTVPATNQGILALRQGKTPLTSALGQGVVLTDDAEIMAYLKRQIDSDTSFLETVHTEQTTYRVLVFPLRTAVTTLASATAIDAESSVGALVIAFDRNAEHAAFNEVFHTYAGWAVGAWLLTGLAGFFFAGRLLQPIRDLARTAYRISDSDLSQRVPVRQADDLGQMASAVNSMLVRLEKSFGAQRQLVDDVSHELRTPITIVRGHLELMDAQDPIEVDSTKELVLDELQRMNLLVTDLTTLATADGPDFLQPTEIDLPEFGAEVFAKARQLGPQRWEFIPALAGTARGDGARITQAWLQLAANAAKFTPATGIIELALTFSAVGEADEHIGCGVRAPVGTPTVRFSVSDTGPGIDPQTLPYIFDRFARSSRQTPGRGLGLPIVAAIVQAHHGWVEVETELGRGTKFTIVLPHHTGNVAAPPV